MRGSINDLFYVILIIFIFAIVTLVAGRILVEWDSATNSTLNATYAQQGMRALEALNLGFILLLVGGAIAVILMAFMIPSHPVFFIISIILLLVFIVVVPQISNIYLQIAGTDSMVDLGNQYSTMTVIMQNLPLFFVVIGIIVMIVMYAKIRGGSNESA